LQTLVERVVDRPDDRRAVADVDGEPAEAVGGEQVEAFLAREVGQEREPRGAVTGVGVAQVVNAGRRARSSGTARLARRLYAAQTRSRRTPGGQARCRVWPPPEDPAAFDQHYAETHVPLAQKIPNVQRFEARKVLGTADGSAAPYYFIAELWFDSPEQLDAAMRSPEGQDAAADVGTFASGGATLMIAEV
jgi:uncharacterized protein (TIGR02118 family)